MSLLHIIFYSTYGQKMSSSQMSPLHHLYNFIQKTCIKLIKSDTKYMYNVIKVFISNKCCSFQLIFIKVTKMFSRFPQKNSNLFSRLIIRNVSSAANQHIRMISERSCDTEDWSNDAENSALIIAINYILSYIHRELLFETAIIFLNK